MPRLFDITKSLYENPEIGTLEYKSSKMLVDTLKDYGFDITYPYIMETGYLAVYDSKKKDLKLVSYANMMPCLLLDMAVDIT